MSDKEILNKLASEYGYSDKMGNVSGLFEHFELGYKAAQAEIAELKEEIQQRKEAYHELDDINTRLNDQRIELQVEIIELKQELTDNAFYTRLEDLQTINRNLQLEKLSLETQLNEKKIEKEMYDNLAVHTSEQLSHLQSALDFAVDGLKAATEIIHQQGNYFNEQNQPAIAILLHSKSTQYESTLEKIKQIKEGE